MKTILCRNVNHALVQGTRMFLDADPGDVLVTSPREAATLEWATPVATVYQRPTERVLSVPNRRANPVFHLVEAMWILAGCEDVETLARFNPRMREYSDDGKTFHAAYGKRILSQFGIDQLRRVITQLNYYPDTRRAVISIWNPVQDLGSNSKDVPCNDMISFKLRNGRLRMMVFNRSNDMIWGAYGANAVQFSVIQEVVARALGVEVGEYTQVSDSFHVYTDGPGGSAWRRCAASSNEFTHATEFDMYERGEVWPVPLFFGPLEFEPWMRELKRTVSGILTGVFPCSQFPFLDGVQNAVLSWNKHCLGEVSKRDRFVDRICMTDWQLAIRNFYNELDAR